MIPAIAFDVMSGDHGPSVTLSACEIFLEQSHDTVLHLFGDVAYIKPWFDTLKTPFKDRILFFHAPEKILNTTAPIDAVRKFKQSSMKLAIESVRNGQTDAIVSSGNTGALMALSKIILSTLPSIDRPAIAKEIPCFTEENRHVVMLDLGANAESTPKNMLDFSILGMALHRCLDLSQHQPSLKILNIGAEHIKGSSLIQDSVQLIEKTSIPFQGFIEGHQIFTADCDVIVCDGFSGNIALKTAEGLARIFLSRLKKACTKNIRSKMGACLLHPAFKEELHPFKPEKYNGACILGLKGIVIKSHGHAKAQELAFALDFAAKQVRQKILTQVESNLSLLLQPKS